MIGGLLRQSLLWAVQKMSCLIGRGAGVFPLTNVLLLNSDVNPQGVVPCLLSVVRLVQVVAVNSLQGRDCFREG